MCESSIPATRLMTACWGKTGSDHEVTWPPPRAEARGLLRG